MATTAESALLAATAAHLGFQLTVSAVVYPALARATDWSAAHSAHSRAIAPVVVVVYGALVVSGAWVLVGTGPTPAVLVALGGAGLSLLVTAAVAAPTHGRLAGGRDEALLRRLLRADWWRTGGAAVGVVGAFLAVV